MPKVTKASRHAKQTVVKWENKENDTIELTDGSDDNRARPAPRALNHTIRSVIYPFDKLDPIVFWFSGPVEVVKVRLLLLFHPNFL